MAKKSWADGSEPELLFENQQKWREWLAVHHDSSASLFLCLSKKGGRVACVAYAEALDVALCYGWIDGQKKAGNDDFFLQRFGPRTKRSLWSKVNCEHVERLIRSGQMQMAGLREVERAKADGRWAAAYDPQSTATVPPDLQRALDDNAKAAQFFSTLDRVNRYAILFRIHNVKKAETRARKIEQYVDMLGRGEKLHS